ncbi:MAG: lysophospholipid acyltransferase family protein [Candidatus Paceibacterota bacterium]
MHMGHFTRTWLGPLIFKLLGTEVEYRGLEHIADSKNYVLVANHGSILDVVAMLVVWCFRFISRLSVKRSPIGWMGRLTGQIFIDYKKRGASMDVIRAAVKEAPDFNFVFFGEGTRSLDGTVQELKLGAMKIAIEGGYSVIPVRIDGAYEVLPKGPFLALRRGKKIVVAFGAPIPPGDDAELLAERVREAILAL